MTLAEQGADFAKASLLLLPVYLVTIGVIASPEDGTGRRTVGLCLLLQLSGYYLVYLFTHLPLAWHLETSLSRLYVHLWPSLVLLLCLYLRSPFSVPLARDAGHGEREKAPTM